MWALPPHLRSQEIKEPVKEPTLDDGQFFQKQKLSHFFGEFQKKLGTGGYFIFILILKKKSASSFKKIQRKKTKKSPPELEVIIK
jgi:hypothetical protein